MTKPRDYKKEYREYHGTPEQIANRSTRNKAHRIYEKKHGNVPSNMDVGHLEPIRKGGGNSIDNLRKQTQKFNRGWEAGGRGR